MEPSQTPTAPETNGQPIDTPTGPAPTPSVPDAAKAWSAETSTPTSAPSTSPATTVIPSAPSADRAVPDAGIPGPAPAGPAWPTAPDNQAPAMPASFTAGAPKKSKKGLLIGLIVAAVVVIFGGASAAAYFGYVVPNKPENVLKTALVNSFSTDKVTSQHFEGKVSITTKTRAPQTFSANYSGGANTSGAMELKADVDALVAKLTLEVRSTDGETQYVKIGGLDGFPELLSSFGGADAAGYAPLIATVNNHWIEITQSMLNQMGVGVNATKLSQADRDKLAAVYKEHQFLTVKEKLKDEKINSMGSYHLRVIIDKQGLKDFVKGLKDAKLDSIKLTQDDVDSVDASLKDVDFSKYPLDMWVDKSTKHIDQLTLQIDSADATANLRYTVVDFNKPVNVTKPAGAKSLMQVISEFMTGMSGMSGMSGNDKLMEDIMGNGISL